MKKIKIVLFIFIAIFTEINAIERNVFVTDYEININEDPIYKAERLKHVLLNNDIAKDIKRILIYPPTSNFKSKLKIEFNEPKERIKFLELLVDINKKIDEQEKKFFAQNIFNIN